MGSSATILTSVASDLPRCKYELKHVVRVHSGAQPEAYSCVYQIQDKEGKLAVRLTKDIVKVAAVALQNNLTTLGPYVLPWSELLKYALDFGLRFTGFKQGKPYQPNFNRGIQHYSLHAGGRGVIEGLGGQLGLTKASLEPSFSSLYTYGNTSSASYWYGFAYAESKQGMRKGDKVWQVGFGSGFKVNSAVWMALKTFQDDSHRAWQHITPADTQKMWSDLEAMGVKFVNGIVPAYEAKKK
jgi:3-ketoacyl-CoA synthase